MTLTNPFGIDRYLHPRRSGMIFFKGGGEPAPVQPAPIVDGGLSDEQYQNLVDNQNEGIGLIGRPGGNPAPPPPPNGLFPNPVLFDNLENKYTTNITPRPGFPEYQSGPVMPDPQIPPKSGATGLYGEFENLGNNVGAGFAGVNTGIAGVNTGVNTGFADLASLLDQYNTDQTTQFAGVNTAMADNAANINTNINTGLGALQTSQDTGFADVGTRFDTVDQSNVNMQTAVDQGFQDQAQGFTDVNANMSAGFDANAAAVNTGFTDAATAMNQGFGDASTQLTNTQANVLEGQQGLGSQLDTMSGTADAYANQSLTNQEALQSGQDQFVSSFDTYVDRYSDDTRLAQDTRADMQTANANANQSIRTDMARSANVAETQATSAARELQAIKLNQAKTAALQAASNPSVDPNVRQNFANLATAFDSNGNVIRTSVDGSGNRIMRSLDSEGNLNLTSYNSLGQPIGNQSLNVAQNLNLLDQLTQSSARRGIASPYANTVS